MLKIIRNIRDVDFQQLIPVYEESNIKYGIRNCPHGSIWEQLRLGEEFLRRDITDFLANQEGILALWVADGCVKAALRLEPFYDGLLISCLETAPGARGKGVATRLISHVVEQYCNQKVYAHIHKNNIVSMKAHQKNGFVVVNDSARLLDGTVTNAYNTLIRE